MAELRFAVRDAIARGITLVLDQERFLNRVTTVIAESSGYPDVAAYLYDPPTDNLVHRGSSIPVPDGRSLRLQCPDIDLSVTQIVPTSAFFGDQNESSDLSTVVVPLRHEGTFHGVIAIIEVASNAVLDSDIESLSVVAEEIAPAIGVAKRHAALTNAVVLDVDTGIYTYEFFVERLEQEIARAVRASNALSIVFVEAVAWESFERNAGYAAADKALRSVARGIADAVRSSDVVARRGRFGFAILLPDSDKDGADVIINRMMKVAGGSNGEPITSDMNGPEIVLLTGWASLPDDGQTSADLALVADQRLQAEVSAAESNE